MRFNFWKRLSISFRLIITCIYLKSIISITGFSNYFLVCEKWSPYLLEPVLILNIYLSNPAPQHSVGPSLIHSLFHVCPPLMSIRVANLLWPFFRKKHWFWRVWFLHFVAVRGEIPVRVEFLSFLWIYIAVLGRVMIWWCWISGCPMAVLSRGRTTSRFFQTGVLRLRCREFRG